MTHFLIFLAFSVLVYVILYILTPAARHLYVIFNNDTLSHISEPIFTTGKTIGELSTEHGQSSRTKKGTFTSVLGTWTVEEGGGQVLSTQWGLSHEYQHDRVYKVFIGRK